MVMGAEDLIYRNSFTLSTETVHRLLMQTLNLRLFFLHNWGLFIENQRVGNHSVLLILQYKNSIPAGFYLAGMHTCLWRYYDLILIEVPQFLFKFIVIKGLIAKLNSE